MKIRVRAKAIGEYNGKIYERGQEFVFETVKHIVKMKPDNSGPETNMFGKTIVEQKDQKLGTWMEKVEGEGK